MRILITNDDGIDSVGLHVLARRLDHLGEVVVAAPDQEYSGFGAALGTLHEIHPEVRKVRLDGVNEAWSVTGPPALCVMFSRLGVFGGPFDLVVSGINPGINVGRAVYHSGTVGAALTARNGRVSGVAVSQAVTGFGIEGQGWDEMLEGQEWETAAAVAEIYVAALLEDLPTDPIVVNLNVPNVPLPEIAGWRHAQIGRVPPRTLVEAFLEPKHGHEDTFHVRMEYGDAVTLPPETDGGTVEQGCVAVTYLTRFVHEERVDAGVLRAERALADSFGTTT